MMKLDELLAGGVLIELGRDQAKAFFGCRDANAVQEFLQKHLTADATNAVGLDGKWELLARCFGDGTLTPGAGEPPLAWCFLGGRAMPSAENETVNLLRPDMVGHLATRLGEIITDGAADWLAERVSTSDIAATDEQIQQAVEGMQKIQKICDVAAKNGSAGVFAAG